MEVYKICDKYDLVKPIAEQCQYNMFVRDDMEKDYRDYLRDTKWEQQFGPHYKVEC